MLDEAEGYWKEGGLRIFVRIRVIVREIRALQRIVGCVRIV